MRQPSGLGKSSGRARRLLGGGTCTQPGDAALSIADAPFLDELPGRIPQMNCTRNPVDARHA